eukprot:CAMPEP_0172518640 /NCGR_PEP_ID=MMETSP1066-20121228/290939_1 /TAXON_ID=671091 /ORGANISM="Coscinodiscus wailesii, Strain CCMP2513" /LENGTH=493 /DNA_ID=CAMNT_0013301067 /DNA_START=65 /DNA_END=1546 /DNA_ORIENTATION=-
MKPRNGGAEISSQIVHNNNRTGCRSDRWDERFKELLAFRHQHGHCRVPNKYSGNPTLGLWVTTQRQQFKYMKAGKRSSMTLERVQMLEDVGFTWTVTGENSATWLIRYEQLKDFKLQAGHCRVPNTYRPNPQLGLWVMNQRQHYKFMKTGKPSIMTPSRIELLEKIGFTWSATEDALNADWKNRFEELKQFREKVGHCCVSSECKPTQILGRWVIEQQIQYKNMRQGKASTMTQERLALLEGLGFRWDIVMNVSEGVGKADPACLEEKADSACLEEKADSACLKEKANTVCPEEKANTVCSEEKANTVCPEEKANTVCPEEKANTVCPEEKTDPARLEEKTDPACPEKKADPACPEKKADPACLVEKADPACLVEKADPACLEKKTDLVSLEKIVGPVRLEEKADPACLEGKVDLVSLEKKVGPVCSDEKADPMCLEEKRIDPVCLEEKKVDLACSENNIIDPMCLETNADLTCLDRKVELACLDEKADRASV